MKQAKMRDKHVFCLISKIRVARRELFKGVHRVFLFKVEARAPRHTPLLLVPVSHDVSG